MLFHKANHYSIKQLLFLGISAEGGRGIEIEAIKVLDVLQGYNGKPDRTKMVSLLVIYYWLLHMEWRFLKLLTFIQFSFESQMSCHKLLSML